MNYKTLYRAKNLTFYYRLTKKSDSQIWNNVTGSLAVAVSWANSAITMTEIETDTGQYPIEIPTDLPAGVYGLIVYLQSGVSPADTDEIDVGEYYKHGGIFGF